jgi:peptidoglycan/LPS O-acetylase OafA/YrhL
VRRALFSEGRPGSETGPRAAVTSSRGPSKSSDGAVPDSPRAGPQLSYVPALDGLRALAVVGVLLFHGGISWTPGGFLGVDAFFVLSGFLITSLLVREWESTGAIALLAFWARRARRLLPALFVLVLFVVAVAAFAMPEGSYPGLRGDAISTLLYVANWHFVAAGSTYFAQTAPPSPLTHTWSLAIEEQFYLLWPIVVLVVLTWTRRLRPLLWVCIAGLLASGVEMALLYRAGASSTRLYYGTDTRAQALLVGAALAVGLAVAAAQRGAATGDPVSWRPVTPWGRALVAALGLAGAAGTAAMWATASGTSPLLYEGGFLLVAVCAAGVVASAVCLPTGWLARALSARPLRDLGRISYGVYLWHYPVFLWVDAQRTGLGGAALFGVRCAITLAISAASFVLLERPVRRGRMLRGRRAWLSVPAGVALSVAIVVAATLPAAPLPAAAAPAASKGAVRVLVIGDSTALTLGVALAQDAPRYGIVQRDVAILGCGVTEGSQVRVTGKVSEVARACNSSPAPRGTPRVETVPTPFGVSTSTPVGEKWTAWYREWVARERPDVVLVLAGRWEVVTRRFHGRWTNILHPSFAAYVERELLHTVRLVTARGARAVLMTAPCYDAGEQPDGQPWPTDAPDRLAAYNRIVEEVAARAGHRATVFGLDALVCPGGVFSPVLGGVVVRSPDGVHFSLTAGTYLSPRIWPFVLKAAR